MGGLGAGKRNGRAGCAGRILRGRGCCGTVRPIPPKATPAEFETSDFSGFVPEKNDFQAGVGFHDFENITRNHLREMKFSQREAVRGLAIELSALFQYADSFFGCWLLVRAEQLRSRRSGPGCNLGQGVRSEAPHKRQEKREYARARADDGTRQRGRFVLQRSPFEPDCGGHDNRVLEVAGRESWRASRR